MNDLSAPGHQASGSPDDRTARAFSESWNRLPAGSVYSREQFVDWFRPLDLAQVRGRAVVELGFGNGSLLVHMAELGPSKLAGVELGNTIERARENLRHYPLDRLDLRRGDLTRVDLGRFDLAYCIGVLHHLSDPESGFQAVLRHARPGGRFHCWVYAHEGNGLVRALVDPLRRVSSRLPWWMTKYFVALPLACPYFLYAKLVARLLPEGGSAGRLRRVLPLADYSRWIARREFAFFLHVAFDQLVAPRTAYLRRDTIERWLGDPEVDPDSTYLRFRNGNSWIFGGRKRGGAA